MKLRLEEKRQAIKLRQQGLSYREIRQIIPNLSKGTISGWLKNITITEENKSQISSRAKTILQKAQLKGAWTNKKKAESRINQIQNEATSQFAKLVRKDLFIAGIMLYWAEGSKKSRCFQFMNSDPRLIAVMLKFLRDVAQVDEAQIKVRLFIHNIYQDENCEAYWSKVVCKPVDDFLKTIYKPTPHVIKKNPEYKGCCRIEITKSEVYWKIMRWGELLFEKL